MQSYEFTSEELEILRDVLRHAASEMDLEVARTDSHDFKVMLKRRRDILDHVLTKLGSAPVAA